VSVCEAVFNTIVWIELLETERTKNQSCLLLTIIQHSFWLDRCINWILCAHCGDYVKLFCNETQVAFAEATHAILAWTLSNRFSACELSRQVTRSAWMKILQRTLEILATYSKYDELQVFIIFESSSRMFQILVRDGFSSNSSGLPHLCIEGWSKQDFSCSIHQEQRERLSLQTRFT
jgi:hypothetical protein